ncbi:MAG: hypothetical protein KGI54_05785 [Pseudomonadota bacterium]|nr:hypothetical protein [Pseudomonadota bacterium]
MALEVSAKPNEFILLDNTCLNNNQFLEKASFDDLTPEENQELLGILLEDSLVQLHVLTAAKATRGLNKEEANELNELIGWFLCPEEYAISFNEICLMFGYNSEALIDGLMGINEVGSAFKAYLRKKLGPFNLEASV